MDKADPRSSSASASGLMPARSTRSRPTGKSQLQSVLVPLPKTRKGKATPDEVERSQDDELGDGENEEGPRSATKNIFKGAQNVSKSTGSKSSRRKSVRRR